MRIHQVLELCVDYVAIDGVLGTDPDDLIAHLRKTDASIDTEYFAHIFTLLAAHQSIQVILTAHPLLSATGEILPGTAPLPLNHGDQTPHGALSVDELYEQGLRGRHLAYHLAGQEYRTDKEAIEELRKAKEEKAKRKKDKVDENGAGPSGTTSIGADPNMDALVTFLEEDDGDVEDRVLRSDYRRLRAKWGSRLRLRATNEEIHFRLVGTHQKHNKITPIVFHILQLAAKARENGITAIELGPAVGTSQGSMHYFMKVLGQLGLCAKVPANIHGAVTNILIFHRFLELNPSYRAMKKMPPLTATAVPDEVDGSAADLGDTSAALDDEEDLEDDQVDPNLSEPDTNWNMNFGPINERELLAGHVVKERLLKLLDSPLLKNHLLKRQNLLYLIGWTGPSVLRHRRAVRRHIEAMIYEGLVEHIQVGDKNIRCLRLTKYNPDFDNIRQSKSAPSLQIEDAIEVPDAQLVAANAHPFAYHGRTSATLNLEFQINKVIADSGPMGLTITDVRDSLDFPFKRMVEHHFTRSDQAFVPPHLRTLEITTTMESHGRERRLRAFSLSAFRQLMTSQNIAIDNTRHPPLSAEVGHWASIVSRPLYASITDLETALDRWAGGDERAFNITKAKGTGGKGPLPKIPKKATAKALPPGLESMPNEPQDGNVATVERVEELDTPGRPSGYAHSQQSRGRPRKYIHVVNEDGTVNRSVIGKIVPIPQLALIYVYMKKVNKLVEAPLGYLGLGPPPPLSSEAIKTAHTPAWFAKFVKADDAASSKKKAKEEPVAGDDEFIAPDDGQAKGSRKQTKEKKRKDPAGETEDAGEAIKPKRTKRQAALDAEKEQPTLEPVAHVMDTPPQQVTGTEAESVGLDVVRTPSLPTEALGIPPDSARNHADPSLSVDPPEDSISTQQRKRKATSPVAVPQPPMATAVQPAPPDINATISEVPAPQPAKRQRGRKSVAPSADQASTSAAPSDAYALLIPAPAKRGRKKATIQQEAKGQLDAVETTPTAAITELQASVPRPPSPMIGEDYERQTPIFDLPEEAEPRELGFVLPQSIQRVKKRKGQNSDQPASALTVNIPSVLHEEIAMGADSSTTTDVDNTLMSKQDIAPLPVSQPSATSKQMAPAASPATTSMPRTPLSPNIATPTRPKDLFNTPDPDSARGSPLPRTNPRTKLALATSSSAGAPRLELGDIRRRNEICQTLRDSGGALVDHRLKSEHYEWSKRVAGTDRPFAPAIASQMDRPVFRRTLTNLLNEGRVKQKSAVVPTPTGRFIRAEVIYLPDISPEALNTYLRDLGTTLTAALTPKRVPKSKVDQVEYTEVKFSDGLNGQNHSSSATPTTVIRHSENTLGPRVRDPAIAPADRRSVLLKDQTVVSSLYGFLGGRGARVALLHRAILETLRSVTDSPGIFATTPRIISLSLFFMELTASVWSKTIMAESYDEEFEELLKNPETKNTRLKDLPPRMCPPKGFAGARSKAKLIRLLNVLNDLKVVVPLSVVDNDNDATVICERSVTGIRTAFKPAESIMDAMYFRIYEFVPVYHIAADASGLLGVLPVNTDQDLDTYWNAVQLACTQSDINSLPRLQHSAPDPSAIAPLTDLLDISKDQKRMLRARQRWSPQIHLHDVQRAAVDDAVDQMTGQSKYNTEQEIRAFAWEYAMSHDVAVEQLNHRIESGSRRSKRKSIRRQDQEAASDDAREKRQKAEADLQKRMAEIRAAAKAEWVARVTYSAAKIGLKYRPELDAWLVRFSVQSLSRRGAFTEQSMDEGCRLFVRSQTIGDIAPPEQIRPYTSRKTVRKFRKDKKIRPPREPRDPNVALQRRRHRWTHEDDDQLLDCEAIVRARAKDKLGNKGRLALVQVFPDTLLQTLFNRLKKIWTMPGKKAYFDRLVDIWYQIWVEHRGTPALPDDHPDSMTEFDLQAHLNFLRARVPKQAVRMAAAAGIQSQTVRKVADLPEDVSVLLDDPKWEYQPVSAPNFNAAWEYAGGQDLRSGDLNLAPLTGESDDGTDMKQDGEGQLRDGKLKTVLKMIIGAPHGTYYHPAGTHVLDAFSGPHIARCTAEMVDDKIIRKHRTSVDGRMYQFQGQWLQMGEPFYPDDLFADAESLPARFDQSPDNKIDWPLIGNVGDMASLMNMVSNHEVDFGFDVKEFPTIKDLADGYNTRRLTDEAFEFKFSAIRVKKVDDPPRKMDPPCMTAMRSPTLWDWDTPDVAEELLSRVVNLAKTASAAGMTRTELEHKLDLSTDQLLSLLARLGAVRPAPVFWAGYDVPRLVHIDHWRQWTVPTRPAVRNDEGVITGMTDPVRDTVPRRWTDIYGELDQFTWERSKKNVLGLIISRPGQSERVLKSRLENIHDRLEIVDLLQYILDMGVVRREGLNDDDRIPPVEVIEREEESKVGWWPNSRRLWH